MRLYNPYIHTTYPDFSDDLFHHFVCDSGAKPCLLVAGLEGVEFALTRRMNAWQITKHSSGGATPQEALLLHEHYPAPCFGICLPKNLGLFVSTYQQAFRRRTGGWAVRPAEKLKPIQLVVGRAMCENAHGIGAFFARRSLRCRIFKWGSFAEV